MRIALVRRAPHIAFSMDVYADGLISGIKSVRPSWEVVELFPKPWWRKNNDPWKSGSGLRKYYERFWNHPRAVSQFDADIFHVVDHTSGHVAYWLKKAGKPVVVTCHDLVQLVYPEILRDQARLPALSMATWKYSVSGLRQADHVVAVSQNTKQDIVKSLGISHNQITVIPNAVDSVFHELPSEEVGNFRQKYCSYPANFCLLNVGSTHQRKNISGILKALHILRSKGLEICLWRVGGKFTSEQAQLVKTYQLEDCVFDLGTPDISELVEIYNSADVLLAPSLYEGFGLTLLEAMACGLPVIAANTSSLPEVVGDSAILVDPLNIDQIVEAVINLKNDPDLRQQLTNKGIERAKLFTWSRSGNQVAEIYEQVLQNL